MRPISRRVRVSQTNIYGFEVLTPVTTKSTILWATKPCIPLKVNQVANWLLHVGYLLNSFFNHEDGGGTFLRNTGWLSADYRLWNSSQQNNSEILSFSSLFVVIVQNFLWYRTFCPYAHAVILNIHKNGNCDEILSSYKASPWVFYRIKYSLINRGEWS